MKIKLLLLGAIVVMASSNFYISQNKSKIENENLVVEELESKPKLAEEKTSWEDIKQNFFVEIKVPKTTFENLKEEGVFKKSNESKEYTYVKQSFEGKNLEFVDLYIEKTNKQEIFEEEDMQIMEINGVNIYVSIIESEETQEEKIKFYRIEWLKNNCLYRINAQNVEIEKLIEYAESLII